MFISLGSSCSIAYQLDKHNKRNCSLPFDWVRIDDLDIITEIINNSFEDFITSVVKVSESDKFPISYDENFPDKITENKSIIMKNKYSVKFYHDFTNGDTGEIEQVNQKYKRRIERFLEFIKSKNNIYFVRDELKPQNISAEKIIRFLDSIKTINKECVFKFIIICHNSQDKSYEILQFSNKYITIINDKEKFGDWKRPNVCWESVFTV